MTNYQKQAYAKEMKNREMVERAIEVLQNFRLPDCDKVASAKTLLIQFLVSQTATKVGKFDLSEFASRDKFDAQLRPALTGVYNDPGPETYKVATDAHILCAIRADHEPGTAGAIFTPKGVRLTEKANRRDAAGLCVRDENGDFIEDVVDLKYPNWRAVCPSVASTDTPYKPVANLLDVEKFAQRYALAKVEAKINKLGVYVDYEHAPGETIRLNAELLAKFITFLKAFPTARMYAADATRALYAMDPMGGRCLLMPIVQQETNNIIIKL